MMTPQQLLIGGAAVIAAGLVAHYAPTMSSAVAPKAMQSANGFGYLSGATPEGLVNLPPPPAPGSAAMKRDVEAREAALDRRIGRATPMLSSNSDRSFEKTLKAYSCAMGMDIGEQATPRLARLLNKMRIDVRHAAGGLRAATSESSLLRFTIRRPVRPRTRPWCPIRGLIHPPEARWAGATRSSLLS